MNGRPKLHFDALDFLFGLFITLNFKCIYWWKPWDKIYSQSRWKMPSRSCSLALVFCTKLYRKLAASRTMLFLPCWELTSRSDSWKASEFGAIARHYLISETVLRIFNIRYSSDLFLMPFSKNRSVMQTGTVKSHIFKPKQNIKSWAPFCTLRIPLHVSKIKTCLWCSQIEINSSADSAF